MNKLTVISELFTFLWQERKWWLIPLVSVLVLLGLFFIFAETSIIAPLVYPLF